MKISLNIHLVLVILSFVSIIVGGTTFAGFICSLIYNETEMTKIFLSLTLIFVVAGFATLYLPRRKLKPQNIKIREGILSVTLCWVFAAVLGAFPYLLAGSHHSFIEAFF